MISTWQAHIFWVKVNMKTLHLVCLTLLLLVSSAVGEGGKVWWDGEDVARQLDVSQSRSQAPSRTPSARPSARPSAAPSVSSQPSRSMQPTYPVTECSQDYATFPFCYNGQGGGSFGYAACLVMNSTTNCGRYDFQILGSNYSTARPINFTKCANVWTWFTRCIAASFPTCRRTNIGIFRGYTFNTFNVKSKTSNKIVEWEVTIEGNIKCWSNCNEGANRWICRDKDEADGMIAFARWVAGVRPRPQSNYSLFTEPETTCRTEAPSQSVAPTASPAPTIASAPSCSDLGYPAYVRNTASSVMGNNSLAGRSYYVSKDCTYVIVAAGPFPEERFDNSRAFLERSASLVGATMLPSNGKFTGRTVNASFWVLNDRVEPFSVTLMAHAALTANWTFVFPTNVGTTSSRKKAAQDFRSFWFDRISRNPLMMPTNLDNDLRCGSGPLCFDEFPRIRCSVDFESEFCGKFDFLTTSAKGAVDRTNNVYDWFHECIQTAYIDKGGPCKINNWIKPTPFRFTHMNTWWRTGSDTTNWTMTFEGRSGGDGKIEYLCPRGNEGKAIIDEMLRFFSLVSDAGYFGMKPAECTKAPTPSPTICAEEDSLLNNPPIYIALVIDVSYSTYRDSFGGIWVGDQNWDGKANTISDAAIAASKALLRTILEMENLNNMNTNIGLILFDTVATYVGNFAPLNANNSAINPVLLSTLETIKIATSEQQVLDSNKGWTNIDDGLDKAILYFKDTSRPLFNDPFNLMVLLSDGKPTVIGDGDNEPFCTVNRADCSKASAATITKCITTNSNACSLDPLRHCVLGSGYDTCEDQIATKMYASELAELDSFGVTRVAIGIGPNSDVARGSALELIDNDPVRISYGLQPRRVMDANGLIAALRDLCPQSTPSPTRSPSAMPSRSPSKTPSAAPSKMPSSKPSGRPSSTPSLDPTAGPTVDICDYQVIDFTTKSGEVLPKAGESLTSLEYEEYGMMIEAIPTLPADVTGLAKIGRAYYYDSGDSSAGMVLVVPAYNDTTKISALGGSITISLAMVHDKVMTFDLWNASAGATVETRDIDGEVLATQIIPYAATADSTVKEVVVDVVGVQTIDISFVGKGGISTIRACGDPLQTKSPSGWKTPEPTNEPTLGPTAGPSSGPTEEENPCPEDIQLIRMSPEDLGGLEYPPLKIKSMDLSNAVLTTSKLISKTVSKVYVEFLHGFYRHCLAYDYLEWSSKDEDITVQCMKTVPLSIVTVYLVHETIANTGVVIPKCCHADAPPGASVVKYTFQISCVSLCPEDE